MIECYDVIKIYTDQETKSRVAALRGIDLKISKGEVVSIIGPSGSGKSTLIKILAGMEPISSGDARVGNFELGKMDTKELLEYRLQSVGIVHQFPERTLFLSGSVMDNLLFAASLYSRDSTKNKKRCKEILKKLGIAHLQDRRVGYLSGGEMIRTAIACALAKNAPLLLCDEPTGQLDSENTEIVKKTLRDIARDYNVTVLVVTHDLRFLKGVDKTCEIHSGRVSALYSVDQDFTVEEQDFPIKYKAQIDSSQNVRIPSEIYRLLQLNTDLEFQVSKESTVELVHPQGIPPKKIEPKKARTQRILQVEPLPMGYHDKNSIAIRLASVSKIYGSKAVRVRALSAVDLTIHKGELAFIIGPSGSGKTTLIKLITGMEPCSSGQLTVLEEQLNNLTDAERSKFRRKNFGIVSQQGELHPYITVQENLFIKDILANKAISADALGEQDLLKIFNQFEIDHRMTSFPLEISGGELQRASLVIANHGDPKILVLDEPTANMDAELAEKVMTKLYQIQKDLQLTLLITTHDFSLVRPGTRVLELLDGKINHDGLADFVEEELN